MKTLNTLAKELYAAKRLENDYKEQRVAIEEAIGELVETPATGSKTVDAGDGMKITVKRGLSFSVDMEELMDSPIEMEKIPLKFVPAKNELDEPAYMALEKTDPALFLSLSRYITSKPKKIAISIKIA